MKHRYICDSCCFARPRNGWLLKPRCAAQYGRYVRNKPIERGVTDLKDICVLYRHKK